MSKAVAKIVRNLRARADSGEAAHGKAWCEGVRFAANQVEAISAIDLEQFRPAVEVYRDHLRRTWKYSLGQGHSQATEGDRLLKLIDSMIIVKDSTT